MLITILVGYFYVQPSFKIFFSGQSFKHFFYMDQEKRDRGGQVKTQNGKAKQNPKKKQYSRV